MSIRPGITTSFVRVHDDAAGVQLVAVRDNFADDAVLDHDVAIEAQAVDRSVEQPSRVHDDASEGIRRLPAEMTRNCFGRASVREHAAEPIGRQIETMCREFLPAGRIRLVLGRWASAHRWPRRSR